MTEANGDDENLGDLLDPWLAYYTDAHVRWGSVPGTRRGTTCDGIIIDVVLDFTRYDSHEQQWMVRLREAIALLRLISVADRVAFYRFLVMFVYHSPYVVDEEMCAVYRGAPFELRFQLQCTGHGEFVTKNYLLMWVMGTRSCLHDQRMEAAYRAARAVLIGRIAGADNKSLLSHPVRLSLLVATEKRASLLKTEEFFNEISSFIEIAEACQREWVPPVDPHEPASPPILDNITLKLRGISITEPIIEAAAACFKAGVPIIVEELELDPRWVSCSSQAMTRFLHLLTEKNPSLQVILGASNHSRDEVFEIDEFNEDRVDFLRRITDPIRATSNIHSVALDDILEQVTAQGNRRVISEELVPALLGRDPPIAEFALGDRTVLSRTDVLTMLEAIDSWRRLHPGCRMEATRVCLVSKRSSAHDGRIFSLLDSIDDARDVAVREYIGQASLSMATLKKVLGYSSLKALSLHGVSITTMDVFDVWCSDSTVSAKPQLESLELKDFELEDVTSMYRFIQRLQDQTHPLARSLRELKLECSDPAVSVWSVDERAAQELYKVLVINSALQSVTISIRRTAVGDESPATEYTRKLQQLSTENGGRTVIIGGRVARYRARVLAFLSVVQSAEPCVPKSCRELDASLLRLIFHWSLPRTVIIKSI